jgi:peptide/nickel transport system substrate-binding protein
MASEAGTEALTARTDFSAVKQELEAAGYDGRTIVFIAPSTVPPLHIQALVAADLLQRMGFVVDLQELEFSAIAQRCNRKEPPDKGGWNLIATATLTVQTFSHQRIL